MTTRLNEAIREATLKAIDQKRFDPQLAAIKERNMQLGDEVYEHLYATIQLRMDELPEGWLPERKDITCYVEGQHVNLNLSRSRRVPYDHKKPSFSRASSLGRKWHKLDADETATRDTRYNAMRAARAMLTSCRTVEALLNAWPRVKPFLPADLSKPPVVVTALAIPMETLNQILGLGGEG